MDLGARSIRSAGQGSGSIEVTLPSRLRDLTGLNCRVSLRDGLRPEIVLAPDLRAAREAFARLWRLLWVAIAPAGTPAPTLPLAEIGAAFDGSEDGQQLAWVDGILLAGPLPHRPEAMSRAVFALARHAALGLGIGAELAPAFGAAVAHALSGRVPRPEHQQACDIAASSLAPLPLPGAAGIDDALDAAYWASAQPALRRLADLHMEFAADPARLTALRRAWRRGVTLELTGD